MATLNLTLSSYNQRILKLCRIYLTQSSGRDLQLNFEIDSNSVSADSFYLYLEEIDRHIPSDEFGFSLGRQLFAEDQLNNMVTGSFINQLMEQFSALSLWSNYATFHFDIVRDRLLIRVCRSKSVRESTKVMDELIVGYVLALLEYSMNTPLDSQEVVIHSPDALSLPDKLKLPQNRAECLSINIPTHWVINTLAHQVSSPFTASNVDSIRSFCRMNLAEPNWGIQQLSQKYQLSVRGIQRLLKRQNLTFKEIIAQERIAQAKLMLDQDKSRDEISRALGFSKPSAFSRFFKKRTGQTLSEYRSFDNGI